MASIEPQFTYKKKSLYRISRTFGKTRLHNGFDYSNSVMKKTLSPHIYRNKTMSDFLIYLNDYIVNLINAVKKFNVRRVYTVDKDYEYID